MNPQRLQAAGTIVLAVIVMAGVAWGITREVSPLVTSFEECVAAGNPVMESYPRQCRHEGQTFTEIIEPSPIEPSPTACTMEAKLCPDGSYVGRSGPKCEFAACPTSPAPAQCLRDSNCVDGNVCHEGACMAPIGKQCAGPNDMSCPTDFACTQGCGPPVVRPGDPPPAYFCQLEGYYRPCPICLAKDTLIDTPVGAVAIQQLRVGDAVWTTNVSGERVLGVVERTSQTRVPSTHTMVKLVLNDGRSLFVSPGHPTVDDRTVGDLVAGDVYDGARVASASRVSYSEGYTYDLLPSGETGFYYANGILLDSTLR